MSSASTPGKDEGGPIVGLVTDRASGRLLRSIPLFASGSEYLGSCLRTGVPFKVKTAKAYDNRGDRSPPYEGCYACDYFKGYGARVLALLGEEGVALFEQHNRKLLQLTGEEEGAGYILFCAQTDEPFDMATYLKHEAQYEDPLPAFEDSEGNALDAQCVYWKLRADFLERVYHYEKKNHLLKGCEPDSSEVQAEESRKRARDDEDEEKDVQPKKRTRYNAPLPQPLPLVQNEKAKKDAQQ